MSVKELNDDDDNDDDDLRGFVHYRIRRKTT